MLTGKWVWIWNLKNCDGGDESLSGFKRSSALVLPPRRRVMEEALETVRAEIDRALKLSYFEMACTFHVLRERLAADGDIGAALSAPCPICGGKEPIARGWLYGISRADGDDGAKEILAATFSKKQPGWVEELSVIFLPAEEEGS